MSRSLALRFGLVIAVWSVGLAARAADAPSGGDLYVQQIKPLLVAKCARCHGALKQESGLRVDSLAGLKAGGDRGAAVVPGKSAAGTLLAALAGKNDIERMPKEAAALSAEQIALIARWIDAGAPAPADDRPLDPRDHWSFRGPVRPAVTLPMGAAPMGAAPKDAAARAWLRGPVDAFVAVEHESRKLVAQGEADRATLARRVAWDLVGLPPTVDELDEFLADESPDAYERLVDRLLASPAHGERWARHWMDVWRYSDWTGWSDGGQIRDSQPHIWRWRDWIVASLNADKPYDRMVLEMLAADELGHVDADTLRATGYLVRNYKMLSRETWMQDVVEHTSKAFLGLTISCARCHDHMYDPITQEDYYHLRAVFEPHQVRLDRVAGELDTKRDGLPRAYDADATVKTHLFLRGDDRHPDTSRSLAPAAPAVFGKGALAVRSVTLPVASFYPDMQRHVIADFQRQAAAETAAAQAEVMKQADAVHALSVEVRKLPAATTDAEKLQATCDALALAGRRLAAAQARQQSLAARVEAELARHGLSSAKDELPKLAAKAALSEKQAAVATSEAEVVAAQQHVARIRRGDAAAKKLVPEGEKQLAAAQGKLDAARAAAAKPGDQYTPLGTKYPESSSGRRLALARWIVSPDNPLAARVAVNHVWLRHFGRALAPTVVDLGRNGQGPTHPGLLDWLAVELRERGQGSGAGGQGEEKSKVKMKNDEPGREEVTESWSMKPVHRLLVTSATYRQRAAGTAVGDPDNVYYWRWQPRRVEAETVRDAVLAVSGALERTVGGPDIDHAQGLVSRRRSLYFRHAPEKQMEFLKLFDVAAPTQCYQRQESVMPQQALALVNSSLVQAESRRLARRLAGDTADPVAFVTKAYRELLSRSPTAAEQQECVTFLHEQEQFFTAHQPRLTTTGTKSAPLESPSTQPPLRARENLIQVLFNHHEFVTVR